MGVIVAFVVVLALVSAAAKVAAATPWYVWATAAVAAVAGVSGVVALVLRARRRDLAVLATVRERVLAPQAAPPVEQHFHFHGVSADEVAEILARRDDL